MVSKNAASILDQYVDFAPTPSSAFDLFKGEWSSRVPGIGGGGADLFDDSRITWLEDRSGGFAGKNVLELGPLEGGHTYMMAMRGARVRAIESNTRAFMKCLIAKNALAYEAEFLLGDFRRYLAETTDRYDLLLMSGVLYHMTDPLTLLADATRVSSQIGVWTHYFDPDVIFAKPDLKKKFSPEPRNVERLGRIFAMHEQRYNEALEWAGFCGGAAPTSYWLTRDSLLGFFEAAGFTVEVGRDEQDHPNGPCVLFHARRR